MNRKSHIGWWLVCVLGLISCQDDLNDPIVVANLDQEFGLTLEETLGEADALRFKVTTLEPLDCQNYSIGLDAMRNESTIDLLVNEILAPQDCQPGPAPATGIEQVEGLMSGLYNLQVSLRGFSTTSGSIRVLPDRYLLSLNGEGAVVPLHEEVFRVPPHSFWGYMFWDDPTGMALADSLRDGIRQIAEPLIPMDGFYGYFEVKGGAIEIYEPAPPSGPGQSYRFLMQLQPHALEDLKDLAESVRENPPAAGLSLEILTSNGERL